VPQVRSSGDQVNEQGRVATLRSRRARTNNNEAAREEVTAARLRRIARSLLGRRLQGVVGKGGSFPVQGAGYTTSQRLPARATASQADSA
jgi:hypothetical protein